MYDYDSLVKRAIIISCVTAYVNTMAPDQLVITLNRVFQRKKKVFINLVNYVKKEVEEKNHPINEVLENISFLGPILFEFVGKNNNHPVKGHL